MERRGMSGLTKRFIISVLVLLLVLGGLWGYFSSHTFVFNEEGGERLIIGEEISEDVYYVNGKLIGPLKENRIFKDGKETPFYIQAIMDDLWVIYIETNDYSESISSGVLEGNKFKLKNKNIASFNNHISFIDSTEYTDNYLDFIDINEVVIGGGVIIVPSGSEPIKDYYIKGPLKEGKNYVFKDEKKTPVYIVRKGDGFKLKVGFENMGRGFFVNDKKDVFLEFSDYGKKIENYNIFLSSSEKKAKEFVQGLDKQSIKILLLEYDSDYASFELSENQYYVKWYVESGTGSTKKTNRIYKNGRKTPFYLERGPYYPMNGKTWGLWMDFEKADGIQDAVLIGSGVFSADLAQIKLKITQDDIPRFLPKFIKEGSGHNINDYLSKIDAHGYLDKYGDFAKLDGEVIVVAGKPDYYLKWPFEIEINKRNYLYREDEQSDIYLIRELADSEGNERIFSLYREGVNEKIGRGIQVTALTVRLEIDDKLDPDDFGDLIEWHDKAIYIGGWDSNAAEKLKENERVKKLDATLAKFDPLFIVLFNEKASLGFGMFLVVFFEILFFILLYKSLNSMNFSSDNFKLAIAITLISAHGGAFLFFKTLFYIVSGLVSGVVGFILTFIVLFFSLFTGNFGRVWDQISLFGMLMTGFISVLVIIIGVYILWRIIKPGIKTYEDWKGSAGLQLTPADKARIEQEEMMNIGRLIREDLLSKEIDWDDIFADADSIEKYIEGVMKETGQMIYEAEKSVPTLKEVY